MSHSLDTLQAHFERMDCEVDKLVRVLDAHDDLVEIVSALVRMVNFPGMVWPAELPSEEFCRSVLVKVGAA